MILNYLSPEWPIHNNEIRGKKEKKIILFTSKKFVTINVKRYSEKVELSGG